MLVCMPSSSGLQIAPPPERSPLPFVLIAAVVIGAVIAAIFWFNPHKTAELAVTHVDVFAPHTEFKSQKGMGLVGALPQSEDDLYVVATVRMTDKLHAPLVLSSAKVVMMESSDKGTEGTVINAADVARLDEIFPAIGKLVTQPFTLDDLQPGQTREGQMVLMFPGMTADQWKAKSSAAITIEVWHRDAQTVAVP
jgi:hypothetical protein